jgi:hypothetical protein
VGSIPSVGSISKHESLGWAFRPEQRQRRYVVLVLLAAVALSIVFGISPTFVGRLLP